MEPKADREIFVWDSELRGFGVRVRPNGRITFILQYRTNDKRQRRRKIADFGVLTVDEARKEAVIQLGALARGVDPALYSDLEQAIPTVAEFAKRYLKDHAEVHKKPRSVAEDRRNLANHVCPALGHLRIDAVTKADIEKFHRSKRAAPIMANRCLALLSKIFSLAEEWPRQPKSKHRPELPPARALDSNPCRKIKKFKERKQHRFLPTQEIERLGIALTAAETDGKIQPGAIAAIRLLLFTGCRRQEILSLKWQYVDFDHACLRLPESKTDAKVVHLSAPALEVLSNIQKVSGNDHVIIGQRRGAHLVNIQKPWGRIREAADLADVRLHDLRHTYASTAAASGLSLPMIGALLGHKHASTTQRYAHLADDPLHAATEKIGDQFAAALDGKDASVVSIEEGRRGRSTSKSR